MLIFAHSHSLASLPNPFRFSQRGVTLVELLFAIVITGVLMSIAFPSFKAWVQNAQIRTATESIKNGLQLARAEAVQRNEPVNFILGNKTSWTVSTVADPVTIIQSRSSSEGSANVDITATPSGTTTVTFNALGRVANSATAPTQFDLDVPTTILPANESRELRINIESGGQIRSCDPIISDSNDPRKC